MSLEKLRALFPDLEIIELVGSGGMGAVYRAHQSRLDREVALKILISPLGTEENFVLRFEREAKVLAKLSHPNIVTIHDFGDVEFDGDDVGGRRLFYFIMEFVDGADLSRLIRGRALTPEQALNIVPQICDALQFAHDQGVTHRDIKPANILLDRRGTVKVADFGLAKLVSGDDSSRDTDLTLTGTSMGTPMYMAPEQWEESVVIDHRADIYSLGVVFYELLTGERPHGIFEPPSQRVQVDVRLDEVVLRSMDKDVERRYQRADEISAGIAEATTTNQIEVARERGGHRQALIGLSLTLLLIAGLAVYFFKDGWTARDAGSASRPNIDAQGEIDRSDAGNFDAGLSLFARAEPGRLMAISTDPAIAPVELEVAEGIDDFVQIGVFANTGGWVALRTDGTLIRSGEGVIAENARTLVRSDGHAAGVVHAYLSESNQLHCLAPNLEPLAPLPLPPLWHVVVQLRPPGMHVHGILNDGSVKYFEWGNPGGQRWAGPPLKLLDGLRSATVNRDRWLLEKSNGDFLLWRPGWTFAFPPTVRTAGLRSGYALMMPKSGPLTHLNMNVPGPPSWQTYFGAYESATSLLVGPNWFGFHWPDGSWRFEPGVMDKFPVVADWLDNIKGLPPAAFALLNRQYPTGENYAKLYWIEPAQGSLTTKPVSDKHELEMPRVKPGRIRGIGMRRKLGRGGGLAPLDLRAAGGITDFVQIRAKHAWGIFAALRATGEVVSNHEPAFDSRSGIARLGQRRGGDQNLIYISHNGKAISAESDRGLRIGAIPKVDCPVKDAAVADSSGMLLLDDGRAVPWGLAYSSQAYIDETRDIASLWPVPAAEDLTNVRGIATGMRMAAVVRNDGSVMAWGEDGTLELPDEIASNIESAIVSSEPKLIVLDREHRLRSWSERNGVEVIPCRGKVVAIAGGDFRWPPIYQTEDGHWHLCDREEQLKKVFPEVTDAFVRLKGLPSDAFFLSMDEQANGEVFLLWIEPVE